MMGKSAEAQRECNYCGVPFRPKTKAHLYCTDACRRHASLGSRRGVPRQTSAAISQALVVTDLLHRGYKVFRGVSPNTAAELLAIDPAAPQCVLRFRVKTVHRRQDGSITTPRQTGGADVLALVDGQVHYLEVRPGSLPEALRESALTS
jgi:hypothetical protein